MEFDWKRIGAWIGVSAVFYVGMKYIAWPLLFYASLPAYELFMSIVLLTIGIGFWIGPAMHHIIEPDEKDSRVALIGVAVVVLLFMAVIFFYAVTHDWEKQHLGTLGDFLGGTLNPILTFLTFVGLIVTILFQQREIHEGKTEANALRIERQDDRTRAERQQFEATFFQMLNYHNSIVNSIDVHRSSTKGTLTGRECFKFFYDELLNGYNGVHLLDEMARSKSAYSGLWNVFQKDLAHYYRFLYNLIRFVNQSKFPKTKYMRIVRAQLSDFEMAIIFYNVATTDRARFKEYIEFYTLFDNLPKSLLLNASHESFFEKSAFDEDEPKKPFSFADIDPDEVPEPKE
ncbi:hypothetical protein B5K08_32140 [Rhizobium leguminosarum bv. trifolii]|uniref:Phage abortive infection protein n=1 Tax=Rhizobium leguminosarum bv. trifolii TaxID=386 RepID=A0A3E1B0Q1_RHILT|nr:putative phage abortive infection protein [Rhizobium leguminosarum]RFB82347.1 hypothetical protein B5K10_32135 [Rhizobium leguminosarum bv. trifolii]RFB82851.1 hypothetical protein B5K08_32140 [Rhizobium leguminosarum bv. trifolii]